VFTAIPFHTKYNKTPETTMARSYIALLLGLGLSPLATALLPSTTPRGHRIGPRQDQVGAVVKLLIGGGPSGTIATAEFDGTAFSVLANNTIPGSSASWLLPRLDGSGDLYAVDENSNTTRHFRLDTAAPAPAAGAIVSRADTIQLVQNATGSAGVVFLEFGVGATRIVGSSYGAGRIDVWDVSAADGSLSLLRQIVPGGELGPNKGRQEASHPHQAILDPTGRFFVANDLGTDTILVIDAQGDAFAITNRVPVLPSGCGPRHGAFFPPGAQGPATHYILACELLSLVQVFQLTYADETLQFTAVQSLSTYGPDSPPADPAGATAGEIQVSEDGRDVYVSNRNTGNATDSISHFGIDTGGGGDLSLVFKDSISCAGIQPRMFSLGLGAGRFVFSTNQDGDLGLIAFRRNADGSLDPAPAASLARSMFGPPGFGPQFVQQI